MFHISLLKKEKLGEDVQVILVPSKLNDTNSQKFRQPKAIKSIHKLEEQQEFLIKWLEAVNFKAIWMPKDEFNRTFPNFPNP